MGGLDSNFLSSVYYQKGQRIERMQRISAREYMMKIIESKDDTIPTVLKTRRTFIYEKKIFVVETFDSLEEPLSILRINATKEEEVTPDSLPIFLKTCVEKNITSKFKMASAHSS